MQTTQLSLIQRLHNADDHEAWQAFAEIYFPAIVNSLKFKGLAPEDAEDAAQQVLMSVARSLAKRPHDPQRARFRTWLERVTRNAALNALQRAPKDRATGGTDMLAVLSDVPHCEEDAALLEREHRKQLLRSAASRIECEFAPDTWQAFWRTTVLGEAIDSVARQLNKQVGSVYAARSRVVRRLRSEIEDFCGQDTGNACKINSPAPSQGKP
jgi:RNA polymerase sigma factor (sigma-70 family)